MISLCKDFGLFCFLWAYEECKQSIKCILGIFIEFQLFFFFSNIYKDTGHLMLQFDRTRQDVKIVWRCFVTYKSLPRLIYNSSNCKIKDVTSFDNIHVVYGRGGQTIL